MVNKRKVICQFQCNIRTHAHRNKRQYLPLLVGNWFVKISNFSTFSRLSLCACAYCCNARIIIFICEYYNVVTVTHTAARLAQLGRAASRPIVGKSESWVRNSARPLFCSSINFIVCVKSFLSCIYEQLAWICGLANKLLWHNFEKCLKSDFQP